MKIYSIPLFFNFAAMKRKPTIWIDRASGLIFFEFFALGVFIAIAAVKLLHINWAYGVVSAFPLMLLFVWLFFKIAIFRWIHCIGFSAGWAYATYLFVGILDSVGSEGSWIMTIGAFIFMLWAHRDDYIFYRDADINIYDHYN